MPVQTVFENAQFDNASTPSSKLAQQISYPTAILSDRPITDYNTEMKVVRPSETPHSEITIVDYASGGTVVGTPYGKLRNPPTILAIPNVSHDSAYAPVALNMIPIIIDTPGRTNPHGTPETTPHAQEKFIPGRPVAGTITSIPDLKKSHQYCNMSLSIQ